MTDATARAFLRGCFDVAIDAVRPGPAVLANLPDKPKGRCVVVGAGKASAAMAAVFDAAWPDVRLSGVVSTRHGHAVPAGRVRVIEAGHPVPDERSVAAARAMLAAVAGLGPDDLVVALVSGGGSACLALPAPGLTLQDKQAMTRALLRSGAPIADMNCVRRHASGIKNGRLALAAVPARVISLVISDIPGDDLSAVASGPTIGDSSTPADALAIIDSLAIPIPVEFRRHLSSLTPRLPARPVEAVLIASPEQALEAAAAYARRFGIEPVLLGDALQGESSALGAAMAATALAETQRPRVLISGGETTVTIGSEGAGRGGRNTEFLLAFALAVKGAKGIWAIAGDSDGIDGTEDAAGAIVSPDVLARAQAAGLDPVASLARHDSYSLFAATRDLVVTGPTLTNVNDLRAVLVI
jgi:hydroxypyruvate reductase